jgi:hypothetical protein
MDVDFRPVFVIGLHRSGTTVLTHALQATGCFNAVTPFHLVYRDQLAAFRHQPGLRAARHVELQEWFEKNAKDRIYDAVPVGPDLPEEYGYVLQKKGPRPRIAAGNLPRFLEFAHNVHLLDDRRRPLLLKNPWETDNFLVIRKIFPQGRFIFIHRDPLYVISSQLRMFGDLLRRPHPYDMLVDGEYRKLWENFFASRLIRCLSSEKLPFLYRRIKRNAALSCNYVSENGSRVSDCSIHLTYGEFCKTPTICLAKILEFLSLSSTRPSLLEGFIHNPARQLHPFVQRDRRDLLKVFEPYCLKFLSPS